MRQRLRRDRAVEENGARRRLKGLEVVVIESRPGLIVPPLCKSYRRDGIEGCTCSSVDREL